ncbi:hypothetical protein [Streptomyces sp. NPDC085540]|uniref:hypothetical protein n=1 Tax=Streptomyces sp. NPDC085540 TaxID=3365730 RepID=UPI0037D3E079
MHTPEATGGLGRPYVVGRSLVVPHRTSYCLPCVKPRRCSHPDTPTPAIRNAARSHANHDGHAWWALLDAQPRPKKHLA